MHKSRKTLERVLTDDKPSHRRHTPSLSRSATEPNLPQLKREVSDVPLISLPAYQAAASKRYSQREVDLSITSQLMEAKVKKKTQIEHELQGAIAALKKPNARMAVKEYVEAAEKRVGDSRSRKPLNPKRYPFAPQVLATPCKDRQKGAMVLSRPPKLGSLPATDVVEIPPSSISKVYCSTAKTKQPMRSFARMSESRTQVACEVEKTPSRGPARFKNSIGQPITKNTQTCSTEIEQVEPVNHSPKLPHYPSALRETPAKTNGIWQPRVHVTSEAAQHVQATPIKGQKMLSLSENALTIINPNQVEPQPVGDDHYDSVDLL